MNTKICGKCKAVKPHTEFYVHKARSDGLSFWCKSCKSDYAKDQYKGPKREETLEYFRDYYAAHKSEMKPKRDAERVAEPWRKLVLGARYRAKKAGMAFDIDVAWGRATYTGQCALSGLSFESGFGKMHHAPLSPSLDRIDNKGGYTKDNCRWICMGLNGLKGTGDDETMYKIALALTLARIQTKTPPEGGVVG